MEARLLLDLQGPVASLTLNRPEALNALTTELGRDLLDALEQIAETPTVRVVVLRGAGRAFCSGVDLKSLTQLGDPQEHVRVVLQEVFHPLIKRLRTLDKPVVAAVGGPAVGLGCALALAADLVIAGRSANFHVAFANIGLSVDGGTSALLTARVGHARASQMALLARPVDAAQACQWGLINEVVDDARLQDTVTATAEHLASSSPGALAAIKQALNAAGLPDLDVALDLEARLQQQRAGSADVAEAIRAFAERRRPAIDGA